MANNKDFKVKNGIQPTAYHEAVGTVTSGVENTGPVGAFSTDLYVGNGSTQTITNNIDLSTDGGLVWIKNRDLSRDHALHDTERGLNYRLSSNNTGGQSGAISGGITPSTTGFSLGSNIYLNDNTYNHVAWTFKKQSSFFDVVTYTGDNTRDRQISHNLGSVPGCIIVKRTDSTSYWPVYHRGLTSNDYYLRLNGTDAENEDGTMFDAAPTSTHFIIGDQSNINTSGATYVAYLFAHDTSADSMIKCFSYTGDGGTAHNIDLGWKPQWLLFKNASTAVTNWQIYDTKRGIPDGTGDLYLRPNLNNADGSVSYIDLTDTGFTLTNNSVQINQSSDTYVCVAIREAVSTPLRTLDLSTGSVFEVTPTSDIKVNLSNPAPSGTVSSATLLLDQVGIGPTDSFSTDLYEGTSAAKTITNNIDLSTDGGLVWFKVRTTTGNHALFDTERGVTKHLATNATDAEGTQAGGLTAFNTNGFTIGNWGEVNESGQDLVAWTFKKGANFFDVVTYTGDGTTSKAISHNLGVEPGFIIVKRTDSTNTWTCYHKDRGSGKWLDLAGSAAEYSSTTAWANTVPTSTNFYVGNFGATNFNTGTYVAYLFAHDTSSDGYIQCGSHTQAVTDAVENIDLGWPAGWLMVKRTDGVDDWKIVDLQRGFPETGLSSMVRPNLSNAESNTGQLTSASNGFNIKTTAGQDIVYVAIRGVSATTITYDSTLEFAGGTAPTSPDVGETDVITISTRDGGTSYQAALAIDGAK